MPSSAKSDNTPQQFDTAQSIHPATPQPPLDTWWQARFKEHPFTAISLAVLTLGGLSLLMFFTRLRVLPDLDLAGATATMAAVAMIGLLVSAALGGSTIAAGISTRNLRTSYPQAFDSWWAVGTFAASAVIAFIGLVALITWFKDEHLSTFGWWILGLTCALLSMRFIYLCRSNAFASPEGSSSSKLTRAYETVMGLIGGGAVWLLMSLSAFLSFYALWPGEASLSDARLPLIAWGLACVAMNIFVAHIPKESELPAIAFMGIGSVFILLALTGNWSGIPVAAVRTLGLGETPVALVLTKQGCNTLNQAARGQAICQWNTETETGWACPVVLQSRIGSPFVVEVTTFDTNGKWPARLPIAKEHKDSPPTLRYRIQLPKADVLSWPSIEALNKPGQPGHINATQLASYQLRDSKGISVEQSRWLRTQCGEQPTNGKSRESTQS